MKVLKIKTILKKSICILILIGLLNGLILFPTSNNVSKSLAFLCSGFFMPEILIDNFSNIFSDLDIKQNPRTDLSNNKNNDEENEIFFMGDDNLNSEQTKKPPSKPEESQIGGNVKEIQYSTTNETISYENIVLLNRTDTQEVDIQSRLENELDLKISDSSKPSVLIYHTHTTESYQEFDLDWYSKDFQGRSLNSEQNMIRIGNEIAKNLESSGIEVIHDTNVYDNPQYSGAYERSGASIDDYLERYPSIEVILDIHRDCIEYDDGTKVKPTATIDGKKAAQIMIIAGCEEGDITGFSDWQYNLDFALNLHNLIESDYSGLMKPLFFAPRKYNMHKSHFSLLIEVGSDVNTLDEAVYSGELLGKSLSKFLENYK